MCESLSMTLIMSKSMLDDTEAAEDIHFVDESCVGYEHDDLHFAITTTYDKCGTTQEV